MDKKLFSREVFDGVVGIVLVLYALGIFIQLVLTQTLSAEYIYTPNFWLQMLLAVLIIYISKDKIKGIKW